MPRQKSLFPRIRLHLYLRQEIVAKLKILFATANTESGVAHGAITKFVEAAIEEKLARMIQANHHKEVKECVSQSASSMMEQQSSVSSDSKMEIMQ